MFTGDTFYVEIIHRINGIRCIYILTSGINILLILRGRYQRKKQTIPLFRSMKNKPKPSSKPKAGAAGAPQTPPVAAQPGTPLFDRLEKWLDNRRYWIIGTLLFLWLAIRIAIFSNIANGPLYQMYKWPESDNAFFDDWARTLSGGDWLNRQPLHPYHGWHDEFAQVYFKQHPDQLNRILQAHPNRDSTFMPGKALWNEWYGGNTYHQEPLYAYMLAALYALTGNGVYWMMVLQILAGLLSGLLLWQLARRYFGDTVALFTGLLYLFCGVILFQETLILRTSWSVFFTLLTIWIFDRASEKRTIPAFLIFGLSVGTAYLLQSTFSLFLLGALAIYYYQERKTPRLFIRNAAVAVAGFVLIFSPVILRNATVGAPLFSTSSVGPVTFAVANVSGTDAISRWAPNAAKCAEILGKTHDSFGATVLETIQTHPSAGSYLGLIWTKFQRVIIGLEWPNNENYYFYKQLVQPLQVAFLDFYWIVWIACAGLLFAWYYRKKYFSMYLAILLQLAIMLGFYVLGRFRTPLVALLLPFAAYALVECLRFTQNKSKESMAKIAVAVVCFFGLTYSVYRPGISMLDPTDYNTLYETVYYDSITKSAGAGQLNQALATHHEFLRFEPDFVKNAKPNQRLQYPSHIEIMDQFANHYQIESFLYEDSGNQAMAAQAMAKRDMMKQIVDQSRKSLMRR
jgi:4-amino-4-deoxy-L-arabinose transferase-like glycosyltransferase